MTSLKLADFTGHGPIRYWMHADIIENGTPSGTSPLTICPAPSLGERVHGLMASIHQKWWTGIPLDSQRACEETEIYAFRGHWICLFRIVQRTNMATSTDPKTWIYGLLREFCESNKLKCSGKKHDLLEWYVGQPRTICFYCVATSVTLFYFFIAFLLFKTLHKRDHLM